MSIRFPGASAPPPTCAQRIGRENAGEGAGAPGKRAFGGVGRPGAGGGRRAGPRLRRIAAIRLLARTVAAPGSARRYVATAPDHLPHLSREMAARYTREIFVRHFRIRIRRQHEVDGVFGVRHDAQLGARRRRQRIEPALRENGARGGSRPRPQIGVRAVRFGELVASCR